MAFRVATLPGSGIEVFYQEGCRVCGSDNNKPLSCFSSKVKVLPGKEIYFCHAAFKPTSSWVGGCAELILCIFIMPVSIVSLRSTVKHQKLCCLVIIDITHLITLEIGILLTF